MKKVWLSAAFIVVASLVTVAQTVVPSAGFLLKTAYEQASKENKKVFVLFHASWCGWCHKMDTTMNDPVCKKFFQDSYVIVHLVVSESKDKKHLENPGAEEMKRTYYGEGQGIPFWLVLDKEGQLLADSKFRKEGESAEEGENIGCPASEAEVEHFIRILRKTSAITDKQEELIKKRFRKNDL